MFSTHIIKFKDLLLDEMKLPDFKGRHLFTARLRILIFLACWAMFFIFYPGIWNYSPITPLFFNIGFLVTTLCYWYVLQEKYVIPMMFIEAFADVLSQTTIVYILGARGWAPFFIYGLYVIATGTLFGYISALVTATKVLVCYSVLLLLMGFDVIPEFIYPKTNIGFINTESFKPYFTLTFLPLALAIVVYTAKIGNHFTKIKEGILERKNIQLTALNTISATIRQVLSLDQVIDRVLNGMIQGLGFDVCFLAFVHPQNKTLSFLFPKNHPDFLKIESTLQIKMADVAISPQSSTNAIISVMQKNRMMVSDDLVELMRDAHPHISEQQVQLLQKKLRFKKFVITPVIAEFKVMGALVGVSRKNVVEEETFDIIDNFANQAALAIESAQLFEELRQKNEELMKANKVKSEFLAIMSHELRTPLIAVIGYTEALLDKVLGDLNADQTKSLNEVLRNGLNLLDLINNILDLAKLESGKMELAIGEYDLTKLAQDVQSSLMPLIYAKEHTFEIHSNKNLPKIQADSMKLRQIFTNLIGNAIKFTERHGKIEVYLDYIQKIAQVKRLFPDFKEIEEKQHQPAFMIRIRDNGIGIKPEDMKMIFEDFKQVDSTFTRKHQGTGLGLALTKQLVTLHGGSLAVTSEYRRGSEFRILLPQ